MIGTGYATFTFFCLFFLPSFRLLLVLFCYFSGYLTRRHRLYSVMVMSLATKTIALNDLLASPRRSKIGKQLDPVGRRPRRDRPLREKSSEHPLTLE